jgi:hypothetical protein
MAAPSRSDAQLAAVDGIPHAQAGRRDGTQQQMAEQAPAAQHRVALGPSWMPAPTSLNAGPARTSALPSRRARRQRRRQAGDAAARDEQLARHAASSCRARTAGCRRGGSTPPRWRVDAQRDRDFARCRPCAR